MIDKFLSIFPYPEQKHLDSKKNVEKVIKEKNILCSK